jgi:PAS domain S-box-containing protein
MKPPLRVLLVEDSDDDEALVVRELQRAYDLVLERVETAEAFREALASQSWDIVLSDYSLPLFNAPEAVRILKETGLDIPCVIVSGTIGEDTAVDAMRAGANDFLLKDRLARLHPAIERELREAAVRKARRDAEESLRASEQRFRAVAETAADAIISFDADGRIVYFNSAALRMFGYSAGELPARPITSLMSGRFDVDQPGDRSASASDIASRTTEIVGLRKDSVEFPIEISIARWTEASAVYFTAIIRDISERKKIEAQLMVSDRMASVGTLAAGVAHEINNPLAAVVTNIELAEEETDRVVRSMADGRELALLLADARVAADRVRNIVKDLKLFSRADDDRRELVDVERVLESSLRIASNEIRHRARLVRDYQPVPAVVANESRLSQVFLNLIVNAAQAIAEGHADKNEIRVATRLESRGRVVVDIGDTGAGMAPEVVKRLFTPFFTTKPIGVGTGLGLSICQRIVSALDGEITVESTPGRGSTFHVFLPAASRHGLATITRAPIAEPLDRSGRVLVIDDESMIASVIERVLRPQHEVHVAKDAAGALALLTRGERFDVILCDMMMPAMSGVDFFHEVQRMDPEIAGSIVFVTGGAFTAAARAFLESIPNARVEKPFDALELRSIVSSMLTRSA